MCEPLYKAGLPKATSGLPGSCWEQGFWGASLLGKGRAWQVFHFPWLPSN